MLPPSLEEWLPERHLARFVSELVEEALDLSAIRAVPALIGAPCCLGVCDAKLVRQLNAYDVMDALIRRPVSLRTLAPSWMVGEHEDEDGPN
ncbi:MAG: hypothetical protein M3072_11335 [Candidatus Dormibacteraeota bacterium]|nr:hypothetical protein [Candidatus Dormibacteraeota bacterium]